MRASLHEGVLPRKDAVRIEELIDYFRYDYAPPETRDTPLKPGLARLQRRLPGAPLATQ